MSRWLRVLFLIHAIIAAVVGAGLLLAPGRLLGAIGWAPIDPILSRVLGAAMLALAWTSFRGWRATEWSQIAIVVEGEAVFAVLACAGLLRHLLVGHWPLMVWGLFVLYLFFAVAWIAALVQHRRPDGSQSQG
jgi:hypothetical protein